MENRTCKVFSLNLQQLSISSVESYSTNQVSDKKSKIDTQIVL